MPSRKRAFSSRFSACVAGLVFFLLIGLVHASPAPAGEPQRGSVSNLPIPRYVSLKSDRVNVREGPSKNHQTVWVYARAGLPVEITAEFETWRKIRDWEGAEGWVQHSLLSGRRTAIVAPWKKEPLPLLDADHKATVARLSPGVVGSLRGCDGSWCHLVGKDFDGFVEQKNLWGVYPNETIE